MKTNTARWPDHHVEALKLIAPTGLSRTQIAKQLNALFPGSTYTRNAVLSKISRLNLSMRPDQVSATNAISSKFRNPPGVSAEQRHAPLKALQPQPFRTVLTDPPGLATSDTLGPHMCRWPIGDPKRDDFTFCGAHVDQGPYCSSHHARAYQPLKPNQPKTGDQLARALRRWAA